MKRTLSTIVLVALLVLTVVALKRIDTTATLPVSGTKTVKQATN